MKALSYSQISLIPRYSELRSRDEADTSVEFLGRRFKLCCLPANMESTINEPIARWLSENDYPYIFHRFSDTLSFVRRANKENWKLISISVGVKEVDRLLLRTIAAEGLRIDWVTIDVAHGHHVLVEEMIGYIKNLEFKSVRGDCVTDSMAIRDGIAGPGRGMTSIPLSYYPKIIAGNVATPEGVRDVTSWGADACKIGIAQGGACQTYDQTGFGVPMFTCTYECATKGGGGEFYSTQYCAGTRDIPSLIPLIIDGGVRRNGDIAKALTAARGVSSLVMCGSLFAACVDAPGESIYSEEDRRRAIHETCCKNAQFENDREWLRKFCLPVAKRYHGSSSAKQKGHNRYIEGAEIEVPCNGMTVEQKLNEIKESLSSVISYAGGRDLSCFKDVGWVEV